MSEAGLNFSRDEYAARLAKTRGAMAAPRSTCHLISATSFPKGLIRQKTDSTSVIEPGAILFPPPAPLKP